MKKRILLWAAAAAFALTTVCSGAAREGAERALRLWATVLAPSLLPCFAAAGMLQRLGAPEALGKYAAPLRRLLRVSEAGVGVFLLGLCGGYPMGAAAAAQAVRSGTLSREEAEHLLAFCDNTGPAFPVGAMGTAVFRSAPWGLFLWIVHVLAAAATGTLLRGCAPIPAGGKVPEADSADPSRAFGESVNAAVRSVLTIGGTTTFFSAMLSAAGSTGVFSTVREWLVSRAPLPAPFLRSLGLGLAELATGTLAMEGLALSPASLALGAFLLGWGGLCVHAQAAAAVSEAGLRLKGHFFGKLLQGAISALLAWAVSPILLR